MSGEGGRGLTPLGRDPRQRAAGHLLGLEHRRKARLPHDVEGHLRTESDGLRHLHALDGLLRHRGHARTVSVPGVR